MIPLSRPIIGEEDLEAVRRVMQSGQLAQGAEVAAFEEEFSRLVDGRRSLAVNAGTSALVLALLGLEAGPGDEVIVPAFSFAASANAVALTGATPVFVDIDPRTCNIDPQLVERAMTERTRGVMVVHLYGQPAAMTELCAIAEAHGLFLVEDAAQAVGAAYEGRPVGTFGDAAAFSFYSTKNMTTGEGGMVVTAREDVADRVLLLRNQGMRQRYVHEVIGFNMRMTDMAAALGRTQLRRLEGWNEQRRNNAAFLSNHLQNVETPFIDPKATHVFHQYTVRTKERDRLQQRLSSAGIGSAVYYPTPLHKLKPFDVGLVFPEAERAAAEVLSLPVRPDLAPQELREVVQCVNG